jgi:2-polyprenyl-3-methyl-5-hydroxy-6-metoxy-1,4-benzoquinol methylase
MDFYTKLPSVPLVGDKHEFVIQQCKGKRVLHLGCVDAGVLEEKWQAGILLHQRLATVATELWGFDIDSAGIQFLQSKGIPHLVAGDGSRVEDLAPLQGIIFDVIVAGEVVEHLLNPGLFLDAIKTLMTPGVSELIVTVPNAYGIDSLVALLRGLEYVHPDHNYWFSYRTITNLILKRDYQIKTILAYSYQLVPFFFRPKQTSLLRYGLSLGKRLVTRILYRISPFFGDGIIVVASRKL